VILFVVHSVFTTSFTISSVSRLKPAGEFFAFLVVMAEALSSGEGLQWSCPRDGWTCGSEVNVSEYQLTSFPKLKEMVTNKQWLKELPWHRLTETCLVRLCNVTDGHEVTNALVAECLRKSNLHTMHGMKKYLAWWSERSVYVREARSMAHWNSKTFAQMSNMGAWLGDCIMSELSVRAGKMQAKKKYRATSNVAYVALGNGVGVNTGYYSSPNNIGNVMEHLMWIALEEEHYAWAVAVQHWVLHQWESQEDTEGQNPDVGLIEEDFLDATVYPMVMYETKEHTGDNISLPSGSWIVAARYASMDEQTSKDVTKIARRILKRKGDLTASNLLFGDPCPKRRKKLIVEACIPPDALGLKRRPLASHENNMISSSAESGPRTSQSDHNTCRGPEEVIATSVSPCAPQPPQPHLVSVSWPELIVLAEHSCEKLSLPEQAHVVDAFYGAEEDAKQGWDVTTHVRDLRARNVDIFAWNKLFGDPIRGAHKRLFVRYEIHK